jgi:ribokinase
VLGESVLGESVEWLHGGKGANQAIGLARLGCDVGFICAVGQDTWGEGLKELLEREGLSKAGVITVDRDTGMAFIFVDNIGSNEIVIVPSANDALSTSIVVESFESELKKAEFVLMQLECSDELVKGLVPLLQSWGVRIILNPAPFRDVGWEVVRAVDFLTPNETELMALARSLELSIVGDCVVEKVATELVQRGAKNIVVTLGDKGALWVSEKGSVLVNSFDVPVIDTTGAGDAFNAGFVCGLLKGYSVEESVELGCKAGAFCVGRSGVMDGLGRFEEVIKIN